VSRFAVALDTATPRFRKLAGRIQARGGQARFVMRWGARIRKTGQERAIAKGGKKFWRDVARSINLVDQGRSASVEATHVAAAQKQYGGPIIAKGKASGGADYLTIPIEGSEAEGHSAKDFSHSSTERLFALFGSTGRGVLGYTEVDSKEFVPLFALVPYTEDQKPDPFMPDEDETLSIGQEEAEEMVKR